MIRNFYNIDFENAIGYSTSVLHFWVKENNVKRGASEGNLLRIKKTRQKKAKAQMIFSLIYLQTREEYSKPLAAS